MTQHTLAGHAEGELLWYQRRSFLLAAAAWTASGGFTGALAQSRSNVVQLLGAANVNGQPLLANQSIVLGDSITTGPNSQLIFVIGNAAFHVRQNSTIVVRGDGSRNFVGLLRLITGAVISTWGKGGRRLITTPTVVAGIRGTGVYTEIFANQGGRGYLCNCYGTIELEAGADKLLSRSDYHQSFWGEVAPKGGRLLTPATPINHSDEELEYLAALLGQRTNWQVLGRKGSRDGRGYIDEQAGQTHPADLLGK